MVHMSKEQNSINIKAETKKNGKKSSPHATLLVCISLPMFLVDLGFRRWDEGGVWLDFWIQ